MVIERPKKIMRAFNPEERYKEVNASSRKTWEMMSNHLGHRTIQDITRMIKCGAIFGFNFLVMILFWKKILVFNY